MIQLRQLTGALTLACACSLVVGCDTSHSNSAHTNSSATSDSRENDMTSGVEPSDSTNQAILDEVNAADAWFHAKKTAPLWAKQLEEAQTVQTLEGPTEASAGDYLCRGAAGEFWPQGADRIAEKYEPTDEVDADGFRKFLPKSEVMAAQVDHDFQIQTSWGLLEGKPGDFVLKNYDDRAADYPESVWIVDKQLFADTYERVTGSF